MKPFIIEITGVLPDDDAVHAALAKVLDLRGEMVELLEAAGATEVHARSTSVRKKTKVGDAAKA